ncbi:hypothetical protein AB0I94_13375 [Streptomyces sp. NPDC050147]|uniref:hypothetical protein n=1 Tax=Streptomyces sp. NPDC050147 TaxID=3155513 RepID=UPI003429389C
MPWVHAKYQLVRDLMTRVMSPSSPSAPPQNVTPEPVQAPTPSPHQPPDTSPRTGFNWQAAEGQIGDAISPSFVETPRSTDGSGDFGDATAWDVSAPGTVRLADVGGMQEGKGTPQALHSATRPPARARPDTATRQVREDASGATASQAADMYAHALAAVPGSV